MLRSPSIPTPPICKCSPIFWQSAHGRVERREPAMVWLVTEIFWFGLVAIIIATDAGARKRKSTTTESIDLSDKSVWPWMMVALVGGPLVLPVYFWRTRRNTGALAAGVGLMVAGL